MTEEIGECHDRGGTGRLKEGAGPHESGGQRWGGVG